MASLTPNWVWTSVVVNLGEAVCALHDRPAAAALYEELRPVAQQVDVLALVVACSGSYGLCAGSLAACLDRWDDAERHFTDALAMNERLGARPFVVHTRRAWAEMLLDRNVPGDAARARDLITTGRAEAGRSGWRASSCGASG